jgi:hypothetical protein
MALAPSNHANDCRGGRPGARAAAAGPQAIGPGPTAVTVTVRVTLPGLLHSPLALARQPNGLAHPFQLEA